MLSCVPLQTIVSLDPDTVGFASWFIGASWAECVCVGATRADLVDDQFAEFKAVAGILVEEEI